MVHKMLKYLCNAIATCQAVSAWFRVAQNDLWAGLGVKKFAVTGGLTARDGRFDRNKNQGFDPARPIRRRRWTVASGSER